MYHHTGEGSRPTKAGELTYVHLSAAALEAISSVSIVISYRFPYSPVPSDSSGSIGALMMLSASAISAAVRVDRRRVLELGVRGSTGLTGAVRGGEVISGTGSGSSMASLGARAGAADANVLGRGILGDSVGVVDIA